MFLCRSTKNKLFSLKSYEIFRMDQNSALEIVDLNSLSDKQKLKEFKSTIKLLKSKEVANRKLGLEKIKDFRYLLEGGCLIPLIESVVPKKVSLYRLQQRP